MQQQHVVSEIVFIRTQLAAITIGISIGYTCTLMLLAKSWMFPIPFTFTVGGLPLVIIMNSFVIATLRLTDRDLLIQYFKYASGWACRP